MLNNKNTNTTVAISPSENLRLANFCKRNEISKKEFISVALNFFEKNGINPKTHNDPKSELEKILKRIDQLFAFIKTQEKEYLRPSVQAIAATENRLKSNLELLATKVDLNSISKEESVKNLINNLYSALKKITLENRESETQEFKNLNKRIVELEEKVMKDLEQLKNKKGINF